MPAEVLIPAPVCEWSARPSSIGFRGLYHDYDILDILLFDVLGHGFYGAPVKCGGRDSLIDRRGVFVAHVEDIPAPRTRIGMAVSSSATYGCEQSTKHVEIEEAKVLCAQLTAIMNSVKTCTGE